MTETSSGQSHAPPLEEPRLRERSLEHMSDAYLLLDAELRITSSNAAAERMLATPPGGLLGRSLADVWPAGGPELASRCRAAVRDGVHALVTVQPSGDQDAAYEVSLHPSAEGVSIFWRDSHAHRRVEVENAYLAAVVRGSAEAMFGLTLDGIIQSWNPAAERLLGYEPGEIIGRHVSLLAPPEKGPEQRDVFARVSAGENVRRETVRVAKDGTHVEVILTTGPVRDAAGRLIGVSAVLVDNRSRKEAEAALRRSESRFRSLFESIDEGFVVIRLEFDEGGRALDYRFMEANAAFERHTGLENAIGRTARELLPNLEEHWFERYGHVATTGEPIRFESSSEVMHRSFNVYAFRFGPAENREVALLFKDVSEERRSALERDRLVHALEVERQRLAAVFRQAPSFLAVLHGPAHVFSLANDAYYQLVGHREIVGKPVADALPEVREQGFLTLLDQVYETGTPFVGREVLVRLMREPSGALEDRYADFIYMPLVEADGQRTGVVAHGTDVTEQVLARREVERLLAESEHARREAEDARAEAEAANRAKGEFLAVMSHELRTPLNAIGGYAELLEMGIRGAVSPAQRDDLRRIQTSQRHLLGLINEVLNYAKLETGSVHFDLAPVSVRATLTVAESLVAPQAAAKGLTLVVGDCPPECVVRADAEKLRQILVNLLSNAVKFTDAGGRIDVVAEVVGDVGQIHVRDTGIGIPQDKLHAIFDPFVQVRADLTRPHEGTGLGLAISRDLARGMDGDLTVASEPGVGSTFTVVLPRA